MASIFHLSNEILIEIVKHLPRPDLLNVRLVCRQFRTLGGDTKLIDIRIQNGISLERLSELLNIESILKNVSKLSLTKDGDEKLFSLQKHVKPIKLNCRNLKKLSLFEVTVEEGISLDDLPPSLRHLSLERVTFECDVTFFSSQSKHEKPELTELRIDETKLTCFGLLQCFGSTLKMLELTDIDGFANLHFNLLKWKLPQLEKLVLISKYDVGKDILKTVRTFKKLKSFELEDIGHPGHWRLKELGGLDDLNTLRIGSFEMSEEDFCKMPIFPSLTIAQFQWSSFANEFCLQIANVFPVLTSLNLWMTDVTDLPFEKLELLGSHPTLNSLNLSFFNIWPPYAANDQVVIRPSSRVLELGFLMCTFGNEAARSIGRYFSNVLELQIGVASEYPNNFPITAMLSGMGKLTTAYLFGEGLTDNFLERFLPALPNTLQKLTLNDDFFETAFSNRSMKTIADHLPGLTTLKLKSRNVTADGLFDLFKLKNLVAFILKSPNIKCNQFEDVKRLLSIVKVVE